MNYSEYVDVDYKSEGTGNMTFACEIRSRYSAAGLQRVISE